MSASCAAAELPSPPPDEVLGPAPAGDGDGGPEVSLRWSRRGHGLEAFVSCEGSRSRKPISWLGKQRAAAAQSKGAGPKRGGGASVFLFVPRCCDFSFTKKFPGIVGSATSAHPAGWTPTPTHSSVLRLLSCMPGNDRARGTLDAPEMRAM